MTASDSLPPIDDELLSAYLDDELSDGEQKRVELRLAADPAARQLLEELRSLSTTLARLPIERPDPDLQVAIRTRLAAEQPTLAAADRSTPDRRGNRRWAWAATAIAAAVLLALFLPTEKPDDLAGVDRRDARDGAAPPSAGIDALQEEDQGVQPESALADGPRLAARNAADDTQPEAARDEGSEFAYARDPPESAAASRGVGPDMLGLDPIAPGSPIAPGGYAAAIPVVELTFASRRATFADFQRVLSAHEVELREADGPNPVQQSAVEQQLRYNVGEADDSTPEEVVLVEATPAQIEHMLQDVYRDRETYSAVTVQGSSGGGYGGRYVDAPETQWRQYARGENLPAVAKEFDSDQVARPQAASAQPELAASQQRQSKATVESINEGESQPVYQPQGWAMRFRPSLGQQADVARAEPPTTEALSTVPSTDGPDQRIQVLFLLQGLDEQ